MNDRSTHKWFAIAALCGLMAVNTACSNAVRNETRASTPLPAASKTETENHAVIEAGDFVTAHYSFRLEGGELVATSSQETDRAAGKNKADWYMTPKTFAPEQLIAGKEKKTPELAQAVIGMRAGEKKTVKLPPEKGFGPRLDTEVKTYPLVKKAPRTVTISAVEYVNTFRTFPAKGTLVNVTPYYISRIVDIGAGSVTLEAEPEDGKIVPSDFGETLVRVEGDSVVMQLSPRVGAVFVAGGKQGAITSVQDDTFTVDFNHPGAGKNLLLDVAVIDVVKAGDFAAGDPAWIEDHDAGYETAAAEKKPMVMILYADWCSWSKRLLTETVHDPRVRKYWDDFVWARINSDENKEYKTFYEQDGYPMIVLIGADGTIVKKLGGFRDARALSLELDQWSKHLKMAVAGKN